MKKRSEFRLKYEQQQRNNMIILATGLGMIVLVILTIVAILSLSRSSTGVTESELNSPAKVNYPAPDLTLENINGDTESLADFREKVVLVNNWATWCPPCKAEMPTLVEFYNDHAKDGFMVIAIEAGETRDLVAEFANQYKMPFAVWLDPDGKSLKAFNNGNLPNSYVIDRTGAIRLIWVGQINRETLEKYVTPLLSEN